MSETIPWCMLRERPPKRGGYTTPAPALDLTTYVRGDLTIPCFKYAKMPCAIKCRKPIVNAESNQWLLYPTLGNCHTIKLAQCIWALTTTRGLNEAPTLKCKAYRYKPIVMKEQNTIRIPHHKHNFTFREYGRPLCIISGRPVSISEIAPPSREEVVVPREEKMDVNAPTCQTCHEPRLRWVLVSHYLVSIVQQSKCAAFMTI